MGHTRAFQMAVAASGQGDRTLYQRWSDPNTWGGVTPVAGQSLTIAGNVLLDIPGTPSLGDLTVTGKLKFDPSQATAITARSITLDGGTLSIGTDVQPQVNLATITLTGAMPTVSGNPGGGPLIRGASHVGDMSTGNNGTTNDNGGLSRGLLAMNGGQLLLKGLMPAVHQTKLALNANPGDTSITVADPVYWKAGMQFALPPTGYQSANRITEIYTVAADTNGSATIQITSPISYLRWGLMMYPTDNGLSLSPNKLITPNMTPAQIASAVVTSFTLGGTNANLKANTNTPTFIDQCAPVELLSRNVIIQGADDTEWATNGFGAHVMVMGLATKAVVDGVAFKRVGQKGLFGRYPFHWHMISYDPATGNLLGDIPTGNGLFTRNSIQNSVQRAVVIHGTCGAVVQNNTCINIKGHAIFTEDGSEQRNVISNNGVYGVRNPDSGFALKSTDTAVNTGSSCFWLSNFANTFTNNRACDFDGVGIWNAIGFYHTSTTQPVVSGSGIASFTQAKSFSGAAAGSPAIAQTVTMTCINAAIPALFSRVGSVSGTLSNIAVGANIVSGLANVNAITMAAVSPFAVGDTVTFSVYNLGGVFGASRLAGLTIAPWNIPPTNYDSNTAWGGSVGVMTDQYPYNEAHDTASAKNDSGGPLMLFQRTQIHHCRQGYQNRIGNPQYDFWTVSDNMTVDLAGATSAGSSHGILTVRQTFNSDVETSALDFKDSGFNDFPHASLSSYHGTLNHYDVTAFGYSGGTAKVISLNTVSYLQKHSALEGWDLYISAVDKTISLNTGWKLFQSDFMFRTPPRWRTQPYFSDITSDPNNQFGGFAGNAGAVYDASGAIAGTSAAAGSYNLTSHPFVTYAANATNSSNTSHSSYTTTRMLGIEPGYTDYGAASFTTSTFGGVAYALQWGLTSVPAYADGVGVDSGNIGTSISQCMVQGHTFTRYDPTTLTVAKNPDGSFVDVYDSPSMLFIPTRIFQHAAIPSGGAALVAIKGATPARRFSSGRLTNFNATTAGGDSTTDVAIIGVPWVGPAIPSVIAIGRRASTNPPALSGDSNVNVPLTQKTSLSDFVAASASVGGFYWYNSTDQIMWMKIMPPNTKAWGKFPTYTASQNLVDWVISA